MDQDPVTLSAVCTIVKRKMVQKKKKKEDNLENINT